MQNRNIPTPDYSHDVDLIVREYVKALRNVRAQMDTLFLSDMQRGNLLIAEHNIREILRELDATALDMTEDLLTKAARNGVADSLYALGLAPSRREALAMVRFGTLNKPFVDMVIADMQTDLLAVTKNTERKTRQVMRQAISDAMREQFTQGYGKTSDLTRATMARLKDEANLAIIDAAGRKWQLETYVKMAVQTKAAHAHRDAEVNSGLEEGSHYGVISSHGAKDACAGYEGKVVALTPDAATADYPYYGTLPRSRIFHPYCKHMITPVFNPDRYK